MQGFSWKLWGFDHLFKIFPMKVTSIFVSIWFLEENFWWDHRCVHYVSNLAFPKKPAKFFCLNKRVFNYHPEEGGQSKYVQMHTRGEWVHPKFMSQNLLIEII